MTWPNSLPVLVSAGRNPSADLHPIVVWLSMGRSDEEVFLRVAVRLITIVGTKFADQPLATSSLPESIAQSR